MPAHRPVVAVVGGGVSGLATAYFTNRAAGGDVDVVVLEAADRIGGKVSTQQVAGHPVDTGPDALLVRVPAMTALLDELRPRPPCTDAALDGLDLEVRRTVRERAAPAHSPDQQEDTA